MSREIMSEGRAFDQVDIRDAGYNERRDFHVGHVRPSDMPIMDSAFMQSLIDVDGINPADVGHFAAELEASNTDGHGRVVAWQTLCNRLQYPEDGLPPSQDQLEAARQAQDNAEAEVNKQLSSIPELGKVELLPYDWRVDLLTEKLRLEQQRASTAEINRKVTEKFEEQLASLSSRKARRRR